MRDLPKLADRHTDTGRFPPGAAYMDGQNLPISEAKMSAHDYGFLHSDATCDVVHVWEGAFLRLSDHLDRYFAGLDKLPMSIPNDKAQVADVMLNCVALSGLRNACVEFRCTWRTSPTFSRELRRFRTRRG